MSLQPIVHGGGITEVARQFGGEPSDWLDLSTGINPNPVAVAGDSGARPGIVCRTVICSIPQARPPATITAAVRCCRWPCREHNPSSSFFRASCHPAGARRSLVRPMGSMAASCGAAGHAVDDIADLSEISAEHGLVVVVNPNNPTGRMLDSETLAALAVRLEVHDGFLLVDEAFGDTEPAASIAALVEKQ